MLQRLRKFLTSVPSITVVGLVSAYLLVGFFLLPAVLKWQLEKQLADRGHVLRVGAVHFDPLRLQLEIDNLALADAQGSPMFGFANLTVDLEWSSITDRTWTIADARLLAPRVRIERGKDGGQYNFSALLAQFAGSPPDPDKKDDGGAFPAVRLERLHLWDGRIEWLDQLLEPPLVSRIHPLEIELVGLSTAAGEPGRYRLNARTDAGESLQLFGTVAIESRHVKGELAVQGLQVATLARGLQRELALQSPRGNINLGGSFDVSIGANGAPAGGARDLQLAIADLFLQPPGSNAPLLAAQKMALNAGRLDLARRELHFDGLQVADASANASIDAQGKGSWRALVPVAQAGGAAADKSAAPGAPAASINASGPASVQATGPASADAPWTMSIGDLRIDRLSLTLRDAVQQRSATVSALALGMAVDARLGGAAGNRVRLAQPRLTIDGLALEQADAGIKLPSTRIDADAITFQAKGRAFDAALDTLSLTLEQGISARSAAQSVSMGASKLAVSAVRARNSGAGVRLELDAPQLQTRALTADQPGQTARIEQLSVAGSSLLLDTGAGMDGGGGSGIALVLDTAKLQMDMLAASTAGPGTPTGKPAASQSARLDQLTLQAQRLKLDLRGADNSLLVDALQAQAPALRLAGIAARRDAERADLAELTLQGSRFDVTHAAAGVTEIAFTGIEATGKQLALARADDSLQLADLALGSEMLKLALGVDAARFSGSGVMATLTGVQSAHAGNRIALQQARGQVRGFEGSSALANSGPAGTSARITGAELSLAALGLGRRGTDTGAVTAASGSGPGTKDMATLASATVSAGDLALDMAGGPLHLRGNAIALRLGQALLPDPSGAATPWVQVADVDLSGAAFSLADRSVSADTLRVSGVRASAWLDAQGNLNLLEALGGSAPTVAPTPPTPPSAPVAGGTPWRIAVKTADLQDTALRFEDRQRDPPLALGLDAVTLNLGNVDTVAGAAPMQVALGAMLASGGQVQAKGSAVLNPQAVDLQLAVTALALAPVQPILSEYMELTLASGTASTRGRLTYGPLPDVRAQLSYTGGFAVDKFLLQEIDPKRPFLAWESVKSDDLKLTLTPDRVDIGEVLLERPVGRLIIAEDQSINITDVLKKKPDTTAKDAAPVDAAAGKAQADPFPVTVARVKVNDGQLEFADLSLRPQFGTRMHQLKGVITGLGTDANRSAQVQLDARVDKFGQARIRGQASLQQPEKLTDITIAFRNLEMSALSPYVVKFAGYEIASGRLTLDLQYKVRDGKLQGDNKLVLTKAELGNKVESPGALDLPLDLALAILKDSNGVIDIAVPVRGDLNDPKFDYGAVIGKAIGNLIGGIVTAPFRALAAMFGGGDKPIDTIAFEPGLATLAPPEQQKIETVARALKERPNLVLTVSPVVAPEQDTPVLQSLTVRSEIARRMGLELAPNEDPGPIDAANPRVPAAVEAAFGARYAPTVFDALRQRAVAAATPDLAVAEPAGTGGAATAIVPAATADASVAVAAQTAAPSQPATVPVPPPEFYQTLIQRMIAEQPVSEEMLAQLAARRAEAIVLAVTGQHGGGVPSAQVQTGALRKATNASAGVVPLKLELDVAK